MPNLQIYIFFAVFENRGELFGAYRFFRIFG